MPRDDIILFLDTETTGNTAYDVLIEIGVVMLDNKEDYPEIGSFNSIVYPNDAAYERMMENDVVRKMHEANGLLQEITNLRKNSYMTSPAYFKGVYPYTSYGVQKRLLDWLDSFTGKDTTHIPYGGSGVMHFDRRYLDRQLPMFASRLTYWAYDVGVLRRSFRKAGAAFYSDEAKTHRALDDARVHAEEWRFYQRVIGGLERA